MLLLLRLSVPLLVVLLLVVVVLVTERVGRKRREVLRTLAVDDGGSGGFSGRERGAGVTKAVRVCFFVQRSSMGERVNSCVRS
ncbi:unnamed protein product [Ectocarpus sp. 6 AP-2014]